MSNATQANRSTRRAAAAKAPKAKAAAALDVRMVADVAKASVAAYAAMQTTTDNADRTLLAKLVEQAKRVGRPIGAAEYGQTIGPAVAAQMKALVSKGKVTESTAATAASRIKTALIGLACGMKPNAGEGFRAFYTRVSDARDTLKAGGQPAFSAASGGRPKVAKGAKTGKKGGASGATVTPASGTEAPADPNARRAAALILAKGSEARADAMLEGLKRPALFDKAMAALARFPDEFSKWADTVVVEPETAMAAALAKAADAKAKQAA